jgi:hypothetical protein
MHFQVVPVIIFNRPEKERTHKWTYRVTLFVAYPRHHLLLTYQMDGITIFYNTIFQMEEEEEG